MGYELANHPPSLFDKGVNRRTAKSALGTLCESKVDVHARLPQHCKCVLDGGHLLHVVPWPTAATYKQVCEAYVTYTVQHYGGQSVVAMAALRQRTQLNNNAAQLNLYLLTFCLSPT